MEEKKEMEKNCCRGTVILVGPFESMLLRHSFPKSRIKTAVSIGDKKGQLTGWLSSPAHHQGSTLWRELAGAGATASLNIPGVERIHERPSAFGKIEAAFTVCHAFL